MECQHRQCECDAAIVTTWRTIAMPAPAYDYECAEHAALTAAYFATRNTSATVAQRTLSV